jgi:hypothetical protein
MLRQLTIVMGLCALLTLACGNSFTAAKPTPPHGPIVVSEAAAEQLKQNTFQALQEATLSNEAVVRVTNEQATSVVALEITRTGQVPITEPQIWFTPNQIHLTGVATGLGPVAADVYMTGKINIVQGKLEVEVVEAKLGAFDFPQTTLVSLTQTVNEALADAAWEITVTQVELIDGEMIIRGKKLQ